MAQTKQQQETGSILGYQAKFVDVDGIRTRYYEAGEENSEVMVLVHGHYMDGFYNANTWTRNLEGLSKRFHVLAPDKLGSGMTDNPKSIEEYTQHALVQHIHAFTQTLGIDEYHLVGQSNGAYTTTRLALEHPEKCKTLIICDSGTVGPAVGDMPARRAALYETMPDDLHGRLFKRWAALGYTHEDLTDEYIEAAMFMGTTEKALQTELDLVDGGTEANAARFPADKAQVHEWILEGRLTMPVLLSWGYNDPTAILPIGHKLFDMICEKSDRAEMHIFNHVGHFHFREIPEEWNRVVTDFIDRCAIPRATYRAQL